MDIVRTSDYVPVVRCKDCRFAESVGHGEKFCLWTKQYIDPEGYCSEGERRVDDD